MRKLKLLCVDFEFQDEIYNRIWDRNKLVDVTVISRADMALKLMTQVTFDFILTTVVMAGKVDGLAFVDEIQNKPDIYGKPKIAIITGLGGDKFHEEVEKRGVYLIDRYEKELADIDYEIDIFLKNMIRPMSHQYPKEHVKASLSDKKLQRQDKLPEILEYNKVSSCENCGSKSLKWIRFRSPQETWDMLCGRDSWLLVCTNCLTQYEEVHISLS